MIPGLLTEHRDPKCSCCEQIPGLCVCWTGMMTDWNTGEVTTYRCSPDQHHSGRIESH